MSASYPSAVKTFTNPTSANNLNLPAHATQHADANDEITAIETELGVSPKGSAATVAARFTALDTTVASGTLSGTRFSALASIPAAAGVIPSANLPTVSTPSPMIYTWTGYVDTAGTGTGFYSGTTLSDVTTTTGLYAYLKDKNVTGGAQTTIVLRTKFKKTSGVSTLTLYAKVWENDTANSATVSAQLNANGLTVDTTTLGGTNPTWRNSTGLDVSSLTNETIYDMSIAIKTTSSGITTLFGYLAAAIVFGS